MKSIIDSLLVLILLATSVHSASNIQTFNYDGILDTSASGFALSSFRKIGTNYYFINVDTELNWFAAAHACRKMGADLVSIESVEEMKLLNDALMPHHPKHFWLSANNLSTKKEFSWLSTGEPMTYIKWNSGEPNNASGHEHCVEIHLKNGEYGMNDHKCDANCYFICEVNAPKTFVLTVW